jgi:hypothetical protein
MSELIQNLFFFHYKYKQVNYIETLLENRVLQEYIQFNFSGPWIYKDHKTTMVVKDISNYFKNESYKILRAQHGGPASVLEYDFKVYPYYITLNSHASGAGTVWLELQVIADEYKRIEHIDEFTSDFFQIEGVNFSIIVPSIDSGAFATSATLTLIYNGTVITYDPYTFSEDNKLKKLNTLPHGQGKVEMLFQIKP